VPVLDEASAMVRNPRTFFYEAELYRLRGNALRKTGTASLEDLETCFQHSLEAARRYATLSLELRAAVSLARVWRDQGKLCQACNLLIEVSSKFTEGLSTGDLAEAYTFVQEMRAEPPEVRGAGLG
jgi:predicted ATPase